MTLAATLADGDRSLKLDAAVEPPSAALPADPHSRRRPSRSSDLIVQVVGKDWPLNFRGDGGLGHGRFERDARRPADQGALGGDDRRGARRLRGHGARLPGGSPRFDRVTLVADLGQTSTASGWSIRRFELACPIGRLHAEGAVPPVEGAATKLRGQVDLVGLTRLLPHTLRLQDGLSVDRGMATLSADLTGAKGAERAEVAASVSDLAATRNGQRVALREVPRLAAVADRAGAKVTVERLELKASGVDVTAAGDLDSGVVLKGIIDLAALDAQIRDLVDLGKTSFAGHARLAADYRHVGSGYKARWRPSAATSTSPA